MRDTSHTHTDKLYFGFTWYLTSLSCIFVWQHLIKWSSHFYIPLRFYFRFWQGLPSLECIIKSEIPIAKLLYHAKTANAHNETESCIIIASTNITISSYNESVYFAFMFLWYAHCLFSIYTRIIFSMYLNLYTAFVLVINIERVWNILIAILW